MISLETQSMMARYLKKVYSIRCLENWKSIYAFMEKVLYDEMGEI